MRSYIIPASSSPWQTPNNPSTTELNKQLVYYAGLENNETNYTWCTAMAGSCNISSSEADSSICPKGWKLPTITEYENMMSAANINFHKCINSTCTGATSASDSIKIRNTPYSFLYAGSVGNSSLSYVGSGGYYWTNTAYDSKNTYRLFFGGSGVSTDFSLRYVGFSVRCIAL